ncbi:kinase-like protein [Dichotomopilus funicola]|uniref:Kinase-like protein n=1 Tax=Dichotomopilus funicola TaxID=1934379 RepID=A0AAN6V4U9_9PEZI|nr:kinase-like protein [Dichotomopilus funicola]
MPNERPSAHWLGSSALQPGVLDDQIQAVLSRANFRHLEKVALAARLQDKAITDSNLTCIIDPSAFAHGFNNVIFEVAFSDSVYWIARIQHVTIDASEAEDNTADLLSDITTMRVIKERTTIPVPTVHAYDVSPSNEVGYPYVLMEALPGRILGGPIAKQVPLEHLPKVAKQLAGVLFQLHARLAFERLGRLWSGDDGNGPVEWFYAERQEDNRQALQSHYQDKEWLAACWVLKTAVSHIIIEPRLRGPFPLCHLDLHYGDILFDDDYNLTGVIDWSGAQTVPLERLAVSPEFITFPAGLAEVNTSIVAFRELVREQLRLLENSRQGDEGEQIPQSTFSDLFGTRRAEITHRCTYSRPYRALWDGRMVAKLIYGIHVSWTQLVDAYGETELC